MSINSFAHIFSLVWSLLALIFGLALILWKRRFVEANAKAFEALYNRTHFSPFIQQSKEMRRPYMTHLVTALGVGFILTGILIVLGILRF
jgi:hypothetical protein